MSARQTRHRGTGAPTESGVDVFRASKAFIVWLAGAVAGISALLYATGYLVTRGQVNLLGLQGLVDFSHDFFLQEAGKFFASIGYDLAISAQLFLIGGLSIAAAAVGIASVLRRFASNAWSRLTLWLTTQVRRRWLRATAVGLLLVGLVALSSALIQRSFAPLCLTDFLYVAEGTVTCNDSEMRRYAKGLQAALLAGRRSELAATFDAILYDVVKIITLCVLAWITTRGLRWRVWLLAPFVIAAVSAIVVLPMDYGVLMRSLRYPRINITPSDANHDSWNTPHFLLTKTESAFVVWSPHSHQVMWIPASSVRRADIVAVEPLLGAQTSMPASIGESK